MPNKKHPDSLLGFCKKSINRSVIKAVTKIKDQHGVGSLTTNTKLKLVQDHLCRNLIPFLIDSLLKNLQFLENLSENIKLMLLKVYMHQDMVDFQAPFRLPNKDFFYELQLIGLTRIVVLNLRMVCTDEILEVIGKHCLSLEIVDIVSKIGSESNKSKNQLNALKLKFYVSDEGLKHLHKCVKLKKIVMNTVIRSNCGGKKITHDGIKNLLHFLPKLQYINYSDMGLVLNDMSTHEQFKLQQLHDNHTSPDHIVLFSLRCPYLKCLCLIVPATNCVETVPALCFDRLSESELNLSSLALGMLPIEPNFSKYLSAKGHHLIRLCLIHKSTISQHMLSTISLYCPNLKHLEVYRLNSDVGEPALVKDIPFSKLEYLKIFGTSWDPQLVLPLCLYKSHSIQELVLVNECYKSVDEAINILITKNQLAFLSDLIFLGMQVSLETMTRFVAHCKHLKNLKINKTHYDYMCMIKEDNYWDLTITTDSLRNFGECLC